MNKLEKRLQNIICLNAQNIDDADDVKSEDDVDATTELSADDKLRNRVNTKKIWKGVIPPEINCGHDLNNVADDGHLNKNKIRRHLPPGTGKYSVGCVDIMNDNNEEGIFCRLFYPVEKTDIFKRNTQWPLWLPRKQYAFGYAHFLKRNYAKLVGTLFHWLGGDVYIPALWQAPLVDSDEKFPVIVLSHGIGGNRTTYSTFCCELASHGYVVAALEHRDGSASMTYLLRDKLRRTVVELIKDRDCGKHKRHAVRRSNSFKEEWRSFQHAEPLGLKWDDYNYRNKQVFHRAEECGRLLDLLTDINEGRSVRNVLGFHFSFKQFKDRLDTSRVALIGHSFGGSTCVSTLGQDERFKVGIMLDAWMHPLNPDMCERVRQPLLLVNYEKFQWKLNVEQQQQWLVGDQGDRRLITLRGACHQAVTDFQFLVSKQFGNFLEVRADLSPKVSMDLNKMAVLSFLAKHFGFESVEGGDDVIDGRHDLVVKGFTYFRPDPPSL